MPEPVLDGRPIGEVLEKKRATLFFKRAFDLFASGFGLLLLAPLFLFVAIRIRTDSPGPVFFRQSRMGRKTKPFRIYKFRTMVQDAESRGRQITVGEDARVTRSGAFLRKYKIDELPQLINVFLGDMSLVGPRPEVPKYLPYYSAEDLSTLWIRPGITAPSSVHFRNESELLAQAEDPDTAYTEDILPRKNALNKDYVRHLSFWTDIRTIFQTLGAL
ncbi:MAG: sugar transferase [Tissierellia bacterium]|jgi:lipopolysaccharide/colanic/teichoic acid biosynthesis glycosyltransferase|nr:sugar transferase [Bacillota bacterium]NLK58194.1 sugar transferase [Tissierellia bacterium]